MIILIWFILICVSIFFIRKFINAFKVPKLNSLVLVSGGVKCGKSTLSVHMAISSYKSRVRAIKFKNFFRKMFKKPLLDLPLLYSNVPLAINYVPVTRAMLMRRERFVYGSVVYLQEASLVADSQLIKDKFLNNQLLLFFKLFGHESKGGICILDTQSVSDVHYSLKRSLSEYFYVHHLTKWIPFFLVAYAVENRYSDDGSVVQVENQDIEEKVKRIIIPKRVWKYFDCYCYSTLTDDLPINSKFIDNNLQTIDLQAHNIVSFRDEFNIEKKECDLSERENSKKTV